MADEPDNLVLTYLRRIDAKIDALAEDIRELKAQLDRIIEKGAALCREVDAGH